MTINIELHVFTGSQDEVTVKVIAVTPPQWSGAVPPELLNTPLQPPVNEARFFQVANLASIAACVWQAASVWIGGQVIVTAGAAVTINNVLQVFGASQSEVTVNVIAVTPPQKLGAVPPELLSTPLHPPVKEAKFFQVLNFVSISACVWQAASVWIGGQVIVTAGAAVTVNVALQVFGASQSDVTVNVSVVLPPQADGAEPPELVSTELQPPLKLTVFFQVVNLLSMED